MRSADPMPCDAAIRAVCGETVGAFTPTDRMPRPRLRCCDCRRPVQVTRHMDTIGDNVYRFTTDVRHVA